MTQISRYQAIWNQLKEKKFVAVSTKAEAHRRLKKAVIKRKDRDLGYKYLMSESNRRASLEFVSEGHILKIFLRITVRSDWI